MNLPTPTAMRHVATAVALGLFPGCTGSGGPNPPGAVPPAPPDHAVRLGPGTDQYRAVTHTHFHQDIQGQRQTSDLALTYVVTISVAPDSGSLLRAAIVLDSILPDSTGLVPDRERARARGARFTGRLEPDGRLTGVEGPDSVLPARLPQLATGFRQIFPRIPTRGARPGDAWTDTTQSTTHASQAEVVLTVVSDHRVAGWSEYAGQPALELLVRSQYTLSGTGAQFGQPFTLDGTGVRSARQYLTAEGRYLGGHWADTSTVDVTLSQMGMLIPGRQVRYDTLALLR